MTRVEIVIVVIVLGALTVLAGWGVKRAQKREHDRQTASSILSEARHLDAAKDQYALEGSSAHGRTAAFADLTPYLKAGSKLAGARGNDSLGNSFLLGGRPDRPRVNPITQSNLQSVTGGPSFWGPYS